MGRSEDALNEINKQRLKAVMGCCLIACNGSTKADILNLAVEMYFVEFYRKNIEKFGENNYFKEFLEPLLP